MTATAFNQKTIDEFHAKNGLDVGRFGNLLLLMTAVGVTTGEPITTPLVHRRDGNNYIVCASKGGAPDHPQWFGNVIANPEVEVEVAKDGGTEKFKARARMIADGPERDRLYAEQAKIWPGFLDYQKANQPCDSDRRSRTSNGLAATDRRSLSSKSFLLGIAIRTSFVMARIRASFLRTLAALTPV